MMRKILGRNATLSVVAIAIAIVAVGALARTTTALTPTVVYDSTVSPLPGNMPSLGYQATQTSEFGDQVSFAGTNRNLSSVTVTLSSWGCQSGAWYSEDCLTTPGATFSHSITFNVYNAGSPLPGSLIATRTQTFNVPYRPSVAVNCTGGRWFDAGSSTCFNGLANNVTFDFSSLNVVLPNTVVYGIVYNTTSYGPSPIGTSAACFSTPQGCGYDSLNVALKSAGPSVGTDLDLDDTFWNTSTASNYTDGGAGGVGIFRRDTGWTGFVPAVKFTATEPLVGPPATKDQCENDGWKTFNVPRTFKNQGDCIQYFNTGK